MNKTVIIYQAKSGAIELRGDFTRDTIWATQVQIAKVFDLERSVITKHIGNILKDKELDVDSVCANFAHTAEDGKTYQVKYYNLDIILAVGYRANSHQAISFRKWATTTLRSYIVEGFAINKSRITKNYKQFLNIIEDVKKLLPSETSVDPKDVIDLVTLFANTWLSLDAYDKELLPKRKLTNKKVSLVSEKMADDLMIFKRVLVEKGEATDIFGHETNAGAVSGIVGNVMQTFDGKELYPTIEEKAAHLLYFMVKNHPFTDGNKRSGAFAFVWFLKQSNILNIQKLTSSALTALTVLVAESDPKHKDKIINLILHLIATDR